MKDAVPLIHIAAEIDPLVTGDAAERLEQPVAGELLRGERTGVREKARYPASDGGRRQSLA